MLSGLSANACSEKAISENDIGKMPQLFYGIFIPPSNKSVYLHTSENSRKSFILKRQTDTTLNEALKYARSKELRHDIYDALREKAIKSRHNESIIIREITGLCSFAKDIFDYCRVTIRMHLDK